MIKAVMGKPATAKLRFVCAAMYGDSPSSRPSSGRLSSGSEAGLVGTPVDWDADNSMGLRATEPTASQSATEPRLALQLTHDEFQELLQSWAASDPDMRLLEQLKDPGSREHIFDITTGHVSAL